jgi:alkylated DNA repair protein (DNA oxidative demethylase)
VCLGWHWQPYQYTREATDVNGRRVLPFPGWMVDLGRRALAEAAGDPHAGGGYAPDAALVNYYDRAARLGMHQDKDERSTAPVVSLSIGDSCTFRFGNTRDRGRPYEDVLLASGDLFVFGGPSRLAYHGVTKVHPATATTHRGSAHHPVYAQLAESNLCETSEVRAAVGALGRWLRVIVGFKLTDRCRQRAESARTPAVAPKPWRTSRARDSACKHTKLSATRQLGAQP